jgi:hypothetical protein
MKKYFLVFTIIFCLFLSSGQAQTKDSTQVDDSTIQKREQDFFLPITIIKNITNRTTKQKLIKDLDLKLAAHRGGTDYYEIGELFAGLHFEGPYLNKVSFRYFGQDGLDYEVSVTKAGFVLKKRAKTSNLEIEPGLEVNDIDGEVRIYRKGNIICQVYDGTYLGFTFYKATSTR